MKNNSILIIGIALLGLGLYGKYSPSIVPDSPAAVVENYVTDAPSDQTLLDNAKKIISILEEADDSTKRSDFLKLSSLYSDMSILIELDNEDKVITDTATIREANSLSGKMLRLNIKDKYPGLAEAAKGLVVSAIGEDDVILDDQLRSKSIDAFRALSWAFYEGSK
jgi:hypothetical protein